MDRSLCILSSVVIQFGLSTSLYPGINVVKNRFNPCKKYKYSDLRNLKIELILK